MLLYQILASTIHRKTHTTKSYAKTMNLKYLRKRGMINLNYQMDY